MKTQQLLVAAEVTRLKYSTFPSGSGIPVRASSRRLLRFKQTSPSRGGFSLIDLLVIIAATIAILVVFLPKLIRSNRHHPGLQCTNNLKQVGLAFRIWAGDNNDRMPTQVSVTNGGAMELTERGLAYAAFQVMSNELNTPKLLYCPRETNPRRMQANAFNPESPPYSGCSPVFFTPTNNLSYFVGLDATNFAPSTILTGDDHFQVAQIKPSPGLLLLQTNAPVEWRNERHPKQGNVCLADGSVQGLSMLGFHAALAQTGVATNRLAMP